MKEEDLGAGWVYSGHILRVVQLPTALLQLLLFFAIVTQPEQPSRAPEEEEYEEA